jgi:hypothetical protein
MLFRALADLVVVVHLAFGGFVERYLLGVLYPEGLTREIQLALGALVLLVNAAVYGWVLLRWRRGSAAGGISARRRRAGEV